MFCNDDDPKVSHTYPFKVTKSSKYMSKIYGGGLEVHRGEVHHYIVMGLDFSEPWVMKVSIINMYIMSWINFYNCLEILLPH